MDDKSYTHNKLGVISKQEVDLYLTFAADVLWELTKQEIDEIQNIHLDDEQLTNICQVGRAAMFSKFLKWQYELESTVMRLSDNKEG